MPNSQGTATAGPGEEAPNGKTIYIQNNDGDITARIERRQVLGGVISEYRRAA